jgi:hypothetical protein
MAENEEQGRDMSRLERRITELDVWKEGFKKEKDDRIVRVHPLLMGIL